MSSSKAGQRLRVLIAGGGTGGHVIPALAIARELRDRHSAKVRFVGTARGLETRLVPEANFPLELIRVGQLKSVSLTTRLRTLADLPLGVARCIALVRSFRPDVVVGVGGYASGPAMMAAILLGTPTLAFEPNAVPGLANRIVGRFVRAAAVNFDSTRQYFRSAVVTGIPVRQEFFAIKPRQQVNSQRLLVFGGSQGARILNEAMPAVAAALLQARPQLTILHQTGARTEQATRQAYLDSGANPAHWQVQAYLDDMPNRFAEADLILCRSGASTMAELAAAGKPSLLVPFALATDDHQRKNADVFVSTGAARMLLERELDPAHLLDTLKEMLANETQLHTVGERARGLAHPNAATRIAEMVAELARTPHS